jgi:subtilase family serine protease
VNPLYQAGITGQGQTIGIMTLANFNTTDAYSYWRKIGLKVAPNRITKVMVDGGTPVAAGVGDNETSLDVEQSGGLAPQAAIRVYIAPNTNSAFIDVFYTAVSENLADTVSISWGEAEEYYFAALNGGVDYTGQLQAIDQALLEGAAQGQSFFAASGDNGAYDANEALPYPDFSMQLSVDAPANDPYITAAGGTTVPTTLRSTTHPNCPAINIAQEQVWGWDYINNDWLTCHGYTPYEFFPTGGGGGVSSFWALPSYQQGVAGVQRTRPGQSLVYYPNYPSPAGQQLINVLPSQFAGRNVPDLSLNADPETGYIVVDCTDFPASSNPGCAQAGWGGTSFVAPQLNGITALIDQASGGRLGLLNPVIYSLQQQGSAYGKSGPFNDITAGDNWYYSGVAGYDDGAGIGTINAANLAYSFMALAEQR